MDTGVFMSNDNTYEHIIKEEDKLFSTGMPTSYNGGSMHSWGAPDCSMDQRFLLESMPVDGYHSFYHTLDDIAPLHPLQDDLSFGHRSYLGISNESVIDDDIYQSWEFNNPSECFSEECLVESNMCMSKEVGRNEGNDALSFESISQYFYFPITEAARKLNVGLTILKKRCRELGIERWPQRKLLSLLSLINNLQGLLGEKGDAKVQNALNILDQERRLMEMMPCLQLQKNTKKLRQACFKANYKRKKKILSLSKA